MFFAAGDLWPSITIGFTFRFSQACLILACMLCPMAFLGESVKPFPGWAWLYGFILWLAVELPFSLFTERSLGYTFWAATDALFIFAFVQYFRSESSLARLASYFLLSFVLLAAMGLAQFALALVGIPILVTQWWIPGLLPRINAISYEPSYYATYTLIGWVASVYLLEKRAEIPSRRLQRTCAIATTTALVLTSSRTGWGMMLAWTAFRIAVSALRMLRAGRVSRNRYRLAVSLPLAIGAAALSLNTLVPNWLNVASEASVLFSGLGVLGQSAHSAAPRESDFAMTVEAFARHPIIGTGIGALTVQVAAQRGMAVLTLEDAKLNEGMSIFMEALASTGLIGGVLLTGFAVAVIRACRRVRPRLPVWRAVLLRAVSWSVVWLLLALQFSQNFLRLWIFIALGVLICCITASADSRSVLYSRE